MNKFLEEDVAPDYVANRQKQRAVWASGDLSMLVLGEYLEAVITH